jgi:hypothetical protein
MTDEFVERAKQRIKQHDIDAEIRFPKETVQKTRLPPLAEQLSETEMLIERRRKEKLRQQGYKPKTFPPDDD